MSESAKPDLLAGTKWPSQEELVAALPQGGLAEEIKVDLLRQVVAAFAAGADYISLTDGGHEVSRIYRDGRHWWPP